MKSILSSALVLSALIAAAVSQGAEALKGRDVVAAGTVQTLSGTLQPDEAGKEWTLHCGSAVYALHLGPEEYRTARSFRIEAGQPAEVRGYVYGEHIAPISLSAGGTTLPLRDEAGKGLWTGKGGGHNKTENTGNSCE